MKSIYLFIPLVTLLFASHTLSAQEELCESIYVVDVRLNVLDCREIYVHIDNQSGEVGFDFGGFRLYDAEGNMIGEEYPWCFTGTGDVTHVIPYDTALYSFDFDTDYDFSLELWSNYYDELVCTWETTSMIRETVTECLPVEFSFVNNTLVPTMFVWTMYDFEGDTMHSEEIYFSPDEIIQNRYMCLDPQCFSLEWLSMNSLDQSMTSLYIVVDDLRGFLYQPMTEDDIIETVDVQLVVKDCEEDYQYPNGLYETDTESFMVYPNPFEEHFTLEAHPDLRTLRLLDVQGRLVEGMHIRSLTSGRLQVELSADLLSGIYLLQQELLDGQVLSSVLIRR